MDGGISKNTKRALLIFAAVLLAAALLWFVLLESNGYARSVCKSINRFGYSLSPSDFMTGGYGDGSSISEVIGKDCSELVSLSRKCGFEGDTMTPGLVELMLCNIEGGKVMYVYLLDSVPQLVFIEDTETGELSSIG